MSKQSECQDTDEDIQRRMMSNWKTSELDKIHKHSLNILISSQLKKQEMQQKAGGMEHIYLKKRKRQRERRRWHCPKDLQVTHQLTESSLMKQSVKIRIFS